MTSSWLRGPELRDDVVPLLAQISLERMRLFAPIAIIGILTALVISVPAGVPLPVPVIAINLAMTAIAIALYIALRNQRIPIAGGRTPPAR